VLYAEAMDPVPSEIIRHYELGGEAGRLSDGLRVLERLRTQELIQRYLPAGPHRIADIGGATGVHAQWLADLGHDVLLVDVVPSHVEAATARRSVTGRVDPQLGDARALPLGDHTVDYALLLGPLYHLTERSDRVLALREAGRVVRPGGFVFSAVISRFASLFDGLARERIFDDAFAAMVEQDLADGQHRNPDEHPERFTTAFFHHPDEIVDEVAEAGLRPVELVGLEGLAAWLPQLAGRLGDRTDLGRVLDAARLIESEPSLLGVSPHLLAVAQVE
jgi:SAM-dependent methyltransferase